MLIAEILAHDRALSRDYLSPMQRRRFVKAFEAALWVILKNKVDRRRDDSMGRLELSLMVAQERVITHPQIEGCVDIACGISSSARTVSTHGQRFQRRKQYALSPSKPGRPVLFAIASGSTAIALSLTVGATTAAPNTLNGRPLDR